MKRQKLISASIRGFSLFELLIALLVLSIGLIGLATLQAQGLRSNNSAAQRTEATFLAQDIADRMRSSMSSNNTLAQNLVALAASYAIDTTGGAVYADPGCNDGCNAAQRPAQDIFDWVTAVQTQLPAGEAVVTQTGGFFLITLMWDDERTGNLGTACSGNSNVDMTCFHTIFQP